MNYSLWGHYILFGIIIGGIKGPAIPQFNQRMELNFHVNSNNKVRCAWNQCGTSNTEVVVRT